MGLVLYEETLVDVDLTNAKIQALTYTNSTGVPLLVRPYFVASNLITTTGVKTIRFHTMTVQFVAGENLLGATSTKVALIRDVIMNDDNVSGFLVINAATGEFTTGGEIIAESGSGTGSGTYLDVSTVGDFLQYKIRGPVTENDYSEWVSGRDIWPVQSNTTLTLLGEQALIGIGETIYYRVRTRHPDNDNDPDVNVTIVSQLLDMNWTSDVGQVGGATPLSSSDLRGGYKHTT